MPSWSRADDPPQDLAGKLVVIPTTVQSELPAGFVSRASAEGAHVIRKLNRRDDIVAAALAVLDDGSGNTSAALAGDFLALGWSHLLVELLTRRMRYISHLDEVHFQTQVLAAAEAAVRGDVESARASLAACFDALAEVRGHYYGVDAYLIDLTLVAPSTMGQSLRDELSSGTAVNVLVSGSVIEQMAQQEPATLDMLRECLERGSASIVGGEFVERELSLLHPEVILAELHRGLEVYQKHLGRKPQVFGRRRFGLTPVLPQLLSKLGFHGALHFTLDDGQFPAGERSKARWEGVDGTAIDAVGRVPLDANRAESFLGLADKLGESMDYDMVATLTFAHWPGQVSPFYQDLRRMTAYTPVVGKFVTLDYYIENTASSGMLSRFEPDSYRPPYFQQSVIRRQADPLSSSVAQLRERIEESSARAITTLAKMLSENPATSDHGGSDVRSSNDVELLSEVQSRPEATLVRTANLTDDLAALARSLSKALETGDKGYLVVNSESYDRIVAVAVPDLSAPPAVDGPIKAVGLVGGENHAVLDVPAMGFVWVGATHESRQAKKQPKPMVEDLTLRNEFCEVAINPETGTILSIHDYRTRGNRLTQQIAFRLPSPRPAPGEVWRDPDDAAVYSVTAVDSIEVTSSGPPLAEVLSTGRLLDLDGQRLAGFRQITCLWFGSRIVRVTIELDVAEEPRADPWNSYYAARFAWPDAGADIFRDVNGGSHATDLKRLESPEFVEIRSDQLRTAILTGGLPYHRRMGMRMLDTLLIARGETARRFELGIGIDVPNPFTAATELLRPPLVLKEVPRPITRAGWFFHVDVRNVIATDWEPLLDGSQVQGFRVRLLETQGRSARAHLQCFRAVESAHWTDFLGNALNTLITKDDTVDVHMGAYEWAQVEVRLKRDGG